MNTNRRSRLLDCASRISRRVIYTKKIVAVKFFGACSSCIAIARCCRQPYNPRMNTLSAAEIESCLAPTAMIDSDHRAIRAYAQEHSHGHATARTRAVALYYAVRDGIRYDPYGLDLTVNGLRASTTLAAGQGWCVSKAILLAAACRAIGIPAALGYADVRNHLSTARMRAIMRTDVFYWHGYTLILLDGAWLKATPAFNIELCEKFRLRPLEFDGHEDSIYHSFDLDGRQHMEYLTYRGEFVDVPLQAIQDDFNSHYMASRSAGEDFADGDFDREVEAEVAARKR